MPINASPHYQKAESEYLQAVGTEKKILCLKKMLSLAPSHKGAENLRAQLRRRLARLKYAKIKEAKSGRSTKKTIRKEGPQAAIIGMTNSGKSSLLKILTNTYPLIAEYKYTTKEPLLGTLMHHRVNAQIIDLQAVDHEEFDKSICNTADLLIIVITKYEDIEKIKPYTEKALGKEMYLLNKTDKLKDNELRKLEAKLKSKKIKYNLFSCKKHTPSQINKIKDKIIKGLGIIRIYLKEPGKEKSPIPMIFQKKKIVIKDVANKIYKGLTEEITDIKIWGPSSKFPGQRVGLKHEIKDLDVVEFKTR